MYEKPTYEELEKRVQELEKIESKYTASREALRESEDRYHSLIDFSPFPFLVTQEEKIVFVNPALVSLFGAGNKGEILGSSPNDWIHPEFTEQGLRRRQKALDSGKTPEPTELCFILQDGREVFVLANTSYIIHQGKPALLSAFQDITTRKKVEQEYKTLFREMLDGFALHEIVCNASGAPMDYRFLAINPAFERMTGLKAQEVIGRTVMEILPGTEHYWIETYGKVALTGEPAFFENFAAGIGKHFEVTAFRPAPGQFACIFQDITERKQADANLKIAHEKMLMILDSIDSTVYVADMETHEILFMNKKMITAFGGDKTGEICFSAFRKQSEPCTFCTNDRLLDKNGNPTNVCSWHDQNPVTGKFYINHDRAVEWTDGRLVRLQIATDITDLKKMEAQLIQTQKMESIGTLAGGIAHDFNNILFPIIGYSEILMADLPKDSPVQDSLKVIYVSAMRAKDLVKQILSFARQEKNELTIMKMQPIVKEAMKLIRSTIPTNISIRQNIQPDCGPIQADPTQIHQIIMNLSTNAYHAMEENGGELTVSLKKIMWEESDLIPLDMSPGSYACLTVADTGLGMNRDIVNKIFDPFFTTKETGKGTGMGLSVVHGIVKSMNGTIQVYSEPGKGTEFKIYLPIVGSVFENQKTDTNPPVPGGIERIFLVEDEAAIIALEKASLSRLGYHVTSCTSSIEALKIFQSNLDQFDLVITDMAMPKMSGDKLAVELIKIRPDIPILLCTGFSESMTDEKIQSLGIKGFLMKPVMMKELAQKIREVLDEMNETIDGAAC